MIERCSNSLLFSSLVFLTGLFAPQLHPVGQGQSIPLPPASSGDYLPAPSPLAPMLERYQQDESSWNRSFSAPWSKARRDERRDFLRGWTEQLDQVAFDQLPTVGRVDYLLLRNELRHELRLLERQTKRNEEIADLVPFDEVILAWLDAQRAMQPIDPAQLAADLDQLAKEIESCTQSVSAGKHSASATVANRAGQYVDQLVRRLSRWYAYYHGYDPLFTWWVAKPYELVAQRLSEHATTIRRQMVGIRGDDDLAIIGDPIGREALLSELAYEMIAYTPEQLLEIAEREYQWCRNELIKASRELGYDDDWRQALNHVKSQHVQPGEQPQLIKELADEAIAFLDERQLVTIPPLCRRTWRMRMMSPARQKMSPYFLGGEVIQVSFPTDAMEHRDKLMSLRGNNVHFARAMVHHELIPGHHLQGFMAARYRPYRRQFSTPFLVEGWALHWEFLLWELDFAKSPENRIGMLFWRTHRCARIVFSLKFHLGAMTAAEAVDYLVENVGHERNNAEAEVRRSVSGDYGPLYQAAYMLGGLQMRSLHQQMVDGGMMTDQQFHDAVLRENSIPLDLIRASLLELPLEREYQSTWEFYGELK